MKEKWSSRSTRAKQLSSTVTLSKLSNSFSVVLLSHWVVWIVWLTDCCREDETESSVESSCLLAAQCSVLCLDLPLNEVSSIYHSSRAISVSVTRYQHIWYQISIYIHRNMHDSHKNIKIEISKINKQHRTK